MISEKIEDTNQKTSDHAKGQENISKENEKFILLLRQYKERLEKLRVEAVEADFEAKYPDKRIALNHLLTMLPQMENFIREGKRDKFLKWLGFAQGVLWSFGEFSLNELREHNRPQE